MRAAYVEQELDQVDPGFADVENFFKRLSHVLADEHLAAVAVADLVALGQRDREVGLHFLFEVQEVFCLVHSFLGLGGSQRGRSHSGLFRQHGVLQRLDCGQVRTEELEAAFEVWVRKAYQSRRDSRCP